MWGQAELVAAGSLLGVGAAALLRGLGTRCAPRARGQVRAPAGAAAASAARDALAKALYCRTVATIVRRANSLKRLGSTLGTLSSDSNESVSIEAIICVVHPACSGTSELFSHTAGAPGRCLAPRLDGGRRGRRRRARACGRALHGGAQRRRAARH